MALAHSPVLDTKFYKRTPTTDSKESQDENKTCHLRIKSDDLAVYLLATREGNILINTDVNDSAPASQATPTTPTVSSIRAAFS